MIYICSIELICVMYGNLDPCVQVMLVDQIHDCKIRISSLKKVRRGREKHVVHDEHNYP